MAVDIDYGAHDTDSSAIITAIAPYTFRGWVVIGRRVGIAWCHSVCCVGCWETIVPAPVSVLYLYLL